MPSVLKKHTTLADYNIRLHKSDTYDPHADFGFFAVGMSEGARSSAVAAAGPQQECKIVALIFCHMRSRPLADAAEFRENCNHSDGRNGGMAEKLDPFDVAALEKSVNDSAVRVSTIWVTYLGFGLYLAAAAVNVTHRQLFLGDAIKLPIVNIDLPLVGFFFLAPTLFVIFHAYLLIQLLLLARTAAAYNEALDHSIENASDSARIRQRLANTLFAQLLAGSPRERAGPLGVALKAMAWATLAIAPALVLLAFEIRFLPYHSELGTWAHRGLIALDLLVVLLIWPAVLEAHREIEWRGVVRYRGGLAAAVGLVFFSVIAISFPGEPHAGWTRRATEAPDAGPQVTKICRAKSWFASILPASFDRLSLEGQLFESETRLADIEPVENLKFQLPYRSERSRSFDHRDFRCALFVGAQLRHAFFFGVNMAGATLNYADLQDAILMRANLQDTNFVGANLRRAFLMEARLQDATLINARLEGARLHKASLRDADLQSAKLQGAMLFEAELQGANLSTAQLQGASLHYAQLQGASLFSAQPQAASLDGAQLQGASLSSAQLQAASLYGAQLQAAALGGAQLQGANLSRAHLQGADLRESKLTLTQFSESFLWRARNGDCADARTTDPDLDPIIELRRVPDKPEERVPAAPAEIERYIERVIAVVPDRRKDEVRERMRRGLVVDGKTDVALAAVWRQCVQKAATVLQPEYDEQHVELLRDLACNAANDGKAITEGIVQNWASQGSDRADFSARLARALLGFDGKDCPGAKDVDVPSKDKLRTLVSVPTRKP